MSLILIICIEKYDQYELLDRVAKLVKAKTHYTLYGFFTIIEIIYNYTNNRHQPKEFWINIINSKLKKKAENNLSGNNNIQAVYGRDSLREYIIAWKCVFPLESKINSKQFGFNSAIAKKQAEILLSSNNTVGINRYADNLSSIEALNLAIQYRDSSIKTWVDSIK